MLSSERFRPNDNCMKGGGNVWEKLTKVDPRKIKAQMALHGDTQDKLADDMGMSRQNLNSKLNEKSEFTLHDLIFLANKYKVSIDYFFCQ